MPAAWRECLDQTGPQCLRLGHRLGTVHAGNLAVWSFDSHHVLTEARQGEVHALGFLEKLVVHALEQVRPALAHQFAAHDALLDGLAYLGMVVLIGRACIAVHLLGLVGQSIEPGAQGGMLQLVVASNIALVRVNLRERGVVHQLGQRLLVFQAPPALRQLVGLSTDFVLVGLHLSGQLVVAVELRQVFAVDVHNLAPAQRLQAKAQPVRFLVAGLVLDALHRHRLDGVAHARSNTCGAGSAETNVGAGMVECTRIADGGFDLRVVENRVCFAPFFAHFYAVKPSSTQCIDQRRIVKNVSGPCSATILAYQVGYRIAYRWRHKRIATS